MTFNFKSGTLHILWCGRIIWHRIVWHPISWVMWGSYLIPAGYKFVTLKYLIIGPVEIYWICDQYNGDKKRRSM